MAGGFGSVEYILGQLGLASAPQRGKDANTGPQAFRSPDTPAATSVVVLDPGKKELDLPVGRRGVVLSPAKCRLICSALPEARTFARTGRSVQTTTAHGTVRSTVVGGVLVLEFSTRGSERPLRMTREKTALVLKYEADIRALSLEP